MEGQARRTLGVIFLLFSEMHALLVVGLAQLLRYQSDPLQLLPTNPLGVVEASHTFRSLFLQLLCGQQLF